jgi:hypothetical protein
VELKVLMKLILNTLVVITALIDLFIPVTASAASSNYSVDGTVKYNGQPVGSNIWVEASCDGHNFYGKTDRYGSYNINVNPAQCRQNSNVSINTNCYGVHGFSHWKQNYRHNYRRNVNVECVQVPEFGATAVTIAATLSIGAFMIIRSGKIGAS